MRTYSVPVSVSRIPTLTLAAALTLSSCLAGALSASSEAMAAESGTVMTVAGGGVADGLPATQAALSAFDAAELPDGNLLVADVGHNRIREIDTATGIINTVAGSAPGPDGYGGFAGDGGPAIDATLQSPRRLAVTPSGDYYIADVANFRVRFVDHTTGDITTVAGTGTSGIGHAVTDGSAQPISVSDIAYDVTTGDLYVADSTGILWALHPDHSLSVVAGGGADFPGDNGPATSARLTDVAAVALTPTDDIVLGSARTGSIRLVHNGVISTLASTFSNVSALAVQADGTILTTSYASSAPVALQTDGTTHAVPNAPCSRLGHLTSSGALLLACGSLYQQQDDSTFTRIAGTDLPP